LEGAVELAEEIFHIRLALGMPAKEFKGLTM